MSDNFKNYSKYYDLLYQDKDYEAETKYLVDLIQKYRPQSKTILELGSGTGIHAQLFSKHHFEVLGVERSADMVAIANQTKNSAINYIVADITNFEAAKKFDVALSIFHVVSYLTDNKGLIQTFKNVAAHLNDGGLFIFDVWHSPAVHAQIPENRTKNIKNEHIEVIRHATPVNFPEQNMVEVNYEVNIKDLSDHTTTVVNEKHPMRHFSKPELEILAYATGFEVLQSEEFLTQAPPSPATWGVCYTLRKR